MNALPFDNITIITGFALVLLGILTPMLNPFFRFRKRPQHDDSTPGTPIVAPPLSLVLTPYDNADRLESNLPFYLQQDYPPGFQVIIVIEEKDHDAEEIITRTLSRIRLEETHAEVYVTHIPKSSRYVSRKKLAITLGIKAAKHDWVMVTEASCHPASSQWLNTMARHCANGNNIVMGYGHYDAATAAFRRFEQLHHNLYLMREAGKGHAFRNPSPSLLLRKSDFLDNGGFLGNLHLARGEYDFLVNKFAKEDATALEISREAWLVEDSPSDKTWLNRHLFRLETGKFLQRAARHRWLYNTDQLALHVTYLACIASIAYAATTQNPILLGFAVVALLTSLVFRGILIHKALTAFGEEIPVWKALFFEGTQVWHNLNYAIRYRFADKNDFTTHKL